MARHTFICAAGRRIAFAPSNIENGCIQFQVLDANRAPLVTLQMSPDLAAIIAEALNLEAVAAADLLSAGA
jgi:hypothetical protein